MLVDEEHIIEEIEIEERELYGDLPGVHLRYNHTDPDIIRDGIDFVAVIEESEEVYRIDYRGYAFGSMRVTADGVEQLGKDLLGNPDPIPNWTLKPETVDADNLPWWVPEETPIAPTISCEVCADEISVRDVLTPQRPLLEVEADMLCRDCWERHS
ncbi:hypothetical protein ACFQJ7_05965 [Halovenus rubra]|uniref:Uncharacterized protein n=2 Tax=Halovenus rubra TaxID=869890 RepID=A0ABD5X7P6_9EURY|nr:hypothetical protein [Halovenus rubra]